MSMAATASSTECSRPRKPSAAGSNACTPSETRLTPVSVNAAKRPASTEVGLASSVISSSAAVSHNALTRPTTAPAVAGSISEGVPPPKKIVSTRSEEHTSELQSRQYLVCRLLLEKKKKTKVNNT